MCNGVASNNLPCICSCHLNDIELTAQLAASVKRLFPYGHPKFNELMLEQMKLHSDKNAGYAGGGVSLGNFDRAANIMANYPNFPVDSPFGITMMYVLKHFDRIMWDITNGKKPSDDALADISVYMTILRCM